MIIEFFEKNFSLADTIVVNRLYMFESKYTNHQTRRAFHYANEVLEGRALQQRHRADHISNVPRFGRNVGIF